MIPKILVAVAVVLLVLVIVIATRPPDFRIERSVVMDAPAAAIHPQVNDLRKMQVWSPWAKMDPAAKVVFEGPAEGAGASQTWAGNKDIGEGTMTVTESHPPERVRMRLDFRKPFAATHLAEFTFKPEGTGTRVTWAMYGKNNFLAKAVNLVIDCDKMVGGEFEKGLADLKTLVETRAKTPQPGITAAP